LSNCHSSVVILMFSLLSLAFLLSLAKTNNSLPCSLLTAIIILCLWQGSPPSVGLWSYPPISSYVNVAISHIIKKPTRVLLGYFLHRLTYKCASCFEFGGGELWIVMHPRKNKKPPPWGDGSMCFQVPCSGSGMAWQKYELIETSTPKIWIYLLGVNTAVLIFHLLPKVSKSLGEAGVIVKGRFASAL